MSVSKRLEGRERFIFPRHIEDETVMIRGEQLEELPAGFDLEARSSGVIDASYRMIKSL